MLTFALNKVIARWLGLLLNKVQSKEENWNASMMLARVVDKLVNRVAARVGTRVVARVVTLVLHLVIDMVRTSQLTRAPARWEDRMVVLD